MSNLTLDTARAPRRTGDTRLAIVDLLAMIALAIGVGAASAIVLGGVVLLLSGGDGQAITTGAMVANPAITRPGAPS